MSLILIDSFIMDYYISAIYKGGISHPLNWVFGGNSTEDGGDFARCPRFFAMLDYLSHCVFCALLAVGPLRVEFKIPVSLAEVKKSNPNVEPGGRFRPKDCVAVQKVAIIIPFRNRDEHLKYWLYYLHPILQRQQLDYGVYVINQVRSRDFVCLSWFLFGYGIYLYSTKDKAHSECGRKRIEAFIVSNSTRVVVDLYSSGIAFLIYVICRYCHLLFASFAF